MQKAGDLKKKVPQSKHKRFRIKESTYLAKFSGFFPRPNGS
jgi:hypothetical protein